MTPDHLYRYCFKVAHKIHRPVCVEPCDLAHHAFACCYPTLSNYDTNDIHQRRSLKRRIMGAMFDYMRNHDRPYRSDYDRKKKNLDPIYLFPSSPHVKSALAVMVEDSHRRKVHAAIAKLKDKMMRGVVMLHYFDDASMTDISKVYGVTTGRISQVHTQACIKLRSSLSSIHREMGRE